MIKEMFNGFLNLFKSDSWDVGDYIYFRDWSGKNYFCVDNWNMRATATTMSGGREIQITAWLNAYMNLNGDVLTTIDDMLTYVSNKTSLNNPEFVSFLAVNNIYAVELTFSFGDEGINSNEEKVFARLQYNFLKKE